MADSAPKAHTTAADVDKSIEKNVSKETIQALEERLRFFFSDANVRQDAFMRKYLMEGDSKAVPVDVLLRFNTIKTITESPDVLVQAARQLGSILTVLEGDPPLIGRVDDFTKNKMKLNIPVTLYLSNLPTNDKRYVHQAEDIRKLFGDEPGIVMVKFCFRPVDRDEKDDKVVASPPHKGKQKSDKIPVGACMVEFESLEKIEASAVHTLTSKDDGETMQPSKVLKLGENVLQVQLYKDFLASQESQKRKSIDQKKKVTDISVAFTKPFTIDWAKGCVIQVKGFSSGCDREAILSSVALEMKMTVDQLKEDSKVYVDYSRGQADGAIRFSEHSDLIPKICEKLASGELLVAGSKVESAVVLSGDDEKQYWEDFIAFKNKQAQQRQDRPPRKKSRRNYSS